VTTELELAVVVPTLNEARRLPALLARLGAGTGPDPGDRADEVVVADGGSADGTRALAAGAGARVVLAPRGRGSQLAAGARATSAALLLFLHADCLPAPGALARLRAAFAADAALVASGMAQRIAARGRFYRLVERAADARARRGMVFGDSGLCARRSAYEAVGGFREQPLFEDVDLARRLARHGAVRLLEDAVLAVSARRWEREGRFRCTLRNWTTRSLYRIGVPPARLAALYPAHMDQEP
jgi:rSAM/selenodomain-associated transferase 2